MTHGADGARLQHTAHRTAAVEETQLVIDQRKHAGRFCFFHHARRFVRVPSHRLLTQHGLALFERSERDLNVCRRRSDDTDKVYVGALNQPPPVIRDVFDTEFFCDCFSAFAATTGDGDNLRPHAVAETGNLRCSRKPSADDTDSNRRLLHGPYFTKFRGPEETRITRIFWIL